MNPPAGRPVLSVHIPPRRAAWPFLGAAFGAAVLVLDWMTVYEILEHRGGGVNDDLAALVTLGMAMIGSALGMAGGALLAARSN
jgi:hypothetical protein